MSSFLKADTKNKLKEIENHTSDLKLYSDDHGHDCIALREYCEQELIKYAEDYVPWLISLIKEMDEQLDSMQDSIYESWGDDN